MGNFYAELILPQHVWTTKDASGTVHLKYDSYAQALIAANASDYASTNTRNPQSVLTQPNGSGIYKSNFQTLYLNYMKTYIPGTTASILNVNQTGTTIAIFSETPCN